MSTTPLPVETRVRAAEIQEPRGKALVAQIEAKLAFSPADEPPAPVPTP